MSVLKNASFLLVLLLVTTLFSIPLSAVPSIIVSAGPDQTVSVNSIMTFDGTNSYSVSNYTWTFNDGGVVTLYGPTPSYQFQTAGIYTVNLYGSNSLSQSGTDTVVITVTATIVDINGNGDYTSIQDAIDNATDGDTILVYDGTYNENLIINKSIRLIGNGSSVCHLNNSFFEYGIIITHDDVLVQGLNIRSIIGGNIVGCDAVRLHDITMIEPLAGITISDVSNLSLSQITISDGLFGLAIQNGVDVSITDCEINRSYFGIYVSNITNLTVSNNTLDSSSMAMIIMEMQEGLIQNNRILNASDAGFYVESCDSLNLEGNEIESSIEGVYLHQSSNISMRNNSMQDGGLLLMGDEDFNHDSHDIDLSNTVNGQPLLYLADQVGGVFDEGYGQVVLFNCSEVTLRNQTLGGIRAGVTIHYSDNLTLQNISASDCSIGVDVYNSVDINTSDSIFQNHSYSGLVYTNSIRAESMNNSFLDCEEGLSLYGGTWNNAHGNSFQNCNYGISINSLENGSITDNNFHEGLYGLYIVYSDNLGLSNNNLQNLSTGVYIRSDRNMTLRDNVMNTGGIKLVGDQEHIDSHDIDLSNLVNGNPLLYLTYVDGMVVDDAYGQIILVNASNVALRNQSIHNVSTGIMLYGCGDSTVDNVTLDMCEIGLSMEYSRNISVQNSAITNSGLLGIRSSSSDDGWFLNITVTSGFNGIYLLNSHNNSILHSSSSQNDISGLILGLSHDNQVLYCNLSSNGENGLELKSESSRNIISHNIIGGNVLNGIFVRQQSDNNTILGNNITDNGCGISINQSAYNIIHSNNFIGNDNQSSDDGNNSWNLPYPGGGNYWDDHVGDDRYHGPNQDIWGGDGYLDARLAIPGGSNYDWYPLLNPWTLDAVAPIADAGDGFTVDRNQAASFNASASTDNVGVVNYTWSYVGLSGTVTFYGSVVDHVFTQAGIYNVTLNVSDAAGNYDTDNITVVVNHVLTVGPVTDANGNPLQGANVTVDYNGQSYGALTDANGMAVFSITPENGVGTAVVNISLGSYGSTSFTLNLDEEFSIESVELVEESSLMLYIGIATVVLAILAVGLWMRARP